MNIKDLVEKGTKSKKRAAKKKAAKNVAIGAGVGAAVGLAAGVLLAPKSGKETREQIAQGVKNAANTVKESIDNVKEKLIKNSAAEEACCCEEACQDNKDD